MCVSVCDCSASKSDSGQVAMKCKEDFFFFPPIFRASKLEKRSPLFSSALD